MDISDICEYLCENIANMDCINCYLGNPCINCVDYDIKTHKCISNGGCAEEIKAGD